MTYYEEKKQNIEKAAQYIASIDGYRVFKNPNHNYFYAVTPSDNVLYFQNDEFFGMVASLEYMPNKKTGSGCRCGHSGNEDGRFYEITPSLLKELENDGLIFAKRLGAKLYANSDAFFYNYWDAKNLVEITA